MMIKTLKYIMLGAALVMAGASCSDNDEYEYVSRPAEPGDAYFGSEPIEEGPSLFDAATINASKIPRVTANKNTGLDEYYPLDAPDILVVSYASGTCEVLREVLERGYGIC
ncbi:hypothetical protein NXY00_16675 [Bacteroides sp. BFG-551]|nr:hypothetical protein [Bacteroides sp. BFG-551]